MTLQHGLGTTEVLVYMTGKNEDGELHQFGFGGYHIQTSLSIGAYWWNLTNNGITVDRFGQDSGAWLSWWHVRVMIWKIPEPTT